MPAGGAGSVGTGTAWTFRRIVPGGDSMVTRSSSAPLRSMSAAATTVTRLRSVPAGEPAGAVGVGLSIEGEGDGSGEADADVPGDGDADPSGLDDGARIRRSAGSPRSLPRARVRALRTARVRRDGRLRGGLCRWLRRGCLRWLRVRIGGRLALLLHPGAGGSWAMTGAGTMMVLASSSAICSRTMPLKKARPR